MKKQQAAIAAMQYLTTNFPEVSTIGIGTGSTINLFIKELAKSTHINKYQAIPSSNATTKLLQQSNIPIIEFNECSDIPIYIDSTDAFNDLKQLVKGGGGALTREKILAYYSDTFICVAEQSKHQVLGKFPIAVEVIQYARSAIARTIKQLYPQCEPQLRTGFITDNGHIILDIHNLIIENPIQLEETLNAIPGVINNGIFTQRSAADVIITDEKII